ncbi:hypothetical protein AB3466_13900 [Sphingobacterium thalpophilum]|uniref:hypothetical protein n=1 Tax=Sphingobacterium thalpophilum TaxID=259 RepID=UPI0037D9A8C4
MFVQPAQLDVHGAGPYPCPASICLLRVWSETGRYLAGVCLRTEHGTKLIRCHTGLALTDVGPVAGLHGRSVLLKLAGGIHTAITLAPPLLRHHRG